MGVFAGCGKEEPAAPATPAAPAAPAAPADPASPATPAEPQYAAVPAVPDLGGLTSNEWLLAREDKIPLNGVAPTHFESRADIYKGLDQVDLNDDDVKIAWLGASRGSSFFTVKDDSAKARIDEYGYSWINYDANFDLTTQTEQLENVLVMDDVDFLVVNATDIDALSNYYTEASEKGIPVIITGPTSGKHEYNVVTVVLAGSWEAGFVCGEYAAKKLYTEFPDGIKIGSVLCRTTDADSASRTCGFISGYLYSYAQETGQPYNSKWDAAVIGYNTFVEMRDSGSAEIPGIINMCGFVTTGDISAAAAQPACAELLTAYPDMDLTFLSDCFGLSMVTECTQMGLKPGEDIYVVYGGDGHAEYCEAVKEGTVLCVGTNVPYPNGEGLVDLIHDIMNGFDANDLPINSYTPTYCVNAENVDEVWSAGAEYASSPEWHIMTTDEYNAANAE